jgi:hypothetical protein
LPAGAAVFGGAAFICTVPVFQQLSILKPDLLALAFAACGLALFETAPSRRGTVAAGICFALALLAKQSIGFALAAALIAALRRGPRPFLWLALTVAAALAVALGALALVAGPAVFEHLVLYNLRDWRDDRFEDLNRKFLGLHWPLLVPALAYAAWGLVSRPRSALTYYPLVALPVLITVGSEGGARNYYLELCLAAGLGAALAVGALLAARPAWASPLGAATLLLLGVYVVRTYTVLVTGAYVPEPLPKQAETYTQLLATVDTVPDPVLSDEPGYLAMRGRPVAVDDFFLQRQMRKAGLWDGDGIAEDLRARRYTLVVTSKTSDEEELRPQWGDAIVDALLEGYVQSGPDTFVPRGQ